MADDIDKYYEDEKKPDTSFLAKKPKKPALKKKEEVTSTFDYIEQKEVQKVVVNRKKTKPDETKKANKTVAAKKADHIKTPKDSSLKALKLFPKDLIYLAQLNPNSVPAFLLLSSLSIQGEIEISFAELGFYLYMETKKSSEDQLRQKGRRAISRLVDEGLISVLSKGSHLGPGKYKLEYQLTGLSI